jgi:hypothetical protein
MIMKKRYYEKQGFKFAKGFLPFFGNMIEASRMMKNVKNNYNPFANMRNSFNSIDRRKCSIFFGQ